MKDISICVASWNSLDYLKILYKSFKRNTKLSCEFYVHNNGNCIETENWLQQNSITHTTSEKNEGFTGINHVLKLVKTPFTFIVNVDMYLLPGWDIFFKKEIQEFKKQGIEKFTLSSDLIEPLGNNPEYIIQYFGHDYQTFQEEELLRFYLLNQKLFNTGNKIQYSHPILVPTKYLEEINYLDTSYFPGWSVDHDLPAELYNIGFRHFKKICKCRVYHFISKTFTKLPKSVNNRNGQDVFEKKWRISVEEFRNNLNITTDFKKVCDGIF